MYNYKAQGLPAFRSEKTLEQLIESNEKDIETITEEKNKIWAEIKDFTVPSNVAQTKYERMEKIHKQINRLKKETARLKQELATKQKFNEKA